MSESPASRIAMVEHRKSFPQAVPSSICTGKSRQYEFSPSKANRRGRLLLRAQESSTLQSLEAPSLGVVWMSFRWGGLRCCRRSGVRRSWPTCCSLGRVSAVSSFPSSFRRNVHSSSDFLRGGVLPAMMTSLALPERSVLRVDL